MFFLSPRPYLSSPFQPHMLVFLLHLLLIAGVHRDFPLTCSLTRWFHLLSRAAFPPRFWERWAHLQGNFLLAHVNSSHCQQSSAWTFPAVCCIICLLLWRMHSTLADADINWSTAFLLCMPLSVLAKLLILTPFLAISLAALFTYRS